jgi:hypothetical protein
MGDGALSKPSKANKTLESSLNWGMYLRPKAQEKITES